MKKIIITAVLTLCAIIVNAQTKNLGLPISYNSKVSLVKQGINLPPVNNEELKTYYTEKSKQTGEKNLKYGFPHEVSIDFFTQAYKQTLPNKSNLYQLLIESKNAISLNVIFDKFRLAEGTVMYLFSQDKKSFIGAYTSLNNNASNELGTELIYHDKIIIEVSEPFENVHKSLLSISRVIHGFINLDEVFDKALNDAEGCNIDVNCPEGDGWENQRNSVAMLVNNTGGFCSGAMVNNTSGTLIPYFLTANHCGSSPGSWVFRFRWEAPDGQTNCADSTNSGNGPVNMNINGGITRARYAPSDFHLIELDSLPDPTWNVTFAGWDMTGNIPITGVGIHHPSGDIKKISVSNMDFLPVAYPSGDIDHWKVFWSAGVTEGGSSGSPIFDQNRRIVGQLHGGASACGGQDLSDSYGMFSVSWEGGGTAASRLKDWLDPSNTGTEVLDANLVHSSDPYLVNKFFGIENVNCTSSIRPRIILTNGGNTTLTNATIYYIIDGITDSISWSGNLSTFESDTVLLTELTLNSGDHNLQVEIVNTNNLTDDVLSNNLISKLFSVVSNGELMNLNLSFDCFANETSWNIQDANNNIIFSGSGYDNNNQEAYTINQKLCLAEECFTINLFDSWGDGMSTTSCAVNGTFNIMTNYGDTLYQMPESESAFGTSFQQTFCVTNFSGVDELYKIQLEIYPNPFENKLVVKSSDIISQILIFDAMGKLIQTINKLDNLYGGEFNLLLASGIYTIRVLTENGMVMKKLIKS